ncbi:hypothetical protein ABIC03_002217 [Bradyrhizobium sp. RT6a]|uniref:hypothetical protein n=1 Tax=Bradyrhizobium sp. RT6a TaxID=3156381 RepID=UPI003392052B
MVHCKSCLQSIELREWAIGVLLGAGAIYECHEHGWMRDRGDPHARERAVEAAHDDPLAGISTETALAELCDFLNSIGDTYPECRLAGDSQLTPALRTVSAAAPSPTTAVVATATP